MKSTAMLVLLLLPVLQATWEGLLFKQLSEEASKISVSSNKMTVSADKNFVKRLADHNQCHQADVENCVEAKIKLKKLEFANELSLPWLKTKLKLIRRENTTEGTNH